LLVTHSKAALLLVNGVFLGKLECETPPVRFTGIRNFPSNDELDQDIAANMLT
jgi:hypothetical protein